jgi:hypothetical protein
VTFLHLHGLEAPTAFHVSKALLTVFISAAFIHPTSTAAERPRIRTFTSSPPAIETGTVAQLSWSAAGASTLSIDQGIGDVTGRDSIYVSPPQTTTYTLTVHNAEGSVHRQTTVTLKPYPPAPLGRGTTYYVSPSGDDNAGGSSPQTAWRTVTKVNGSSLKPGDNVLFQRGGEWRESLKAPASGETGNPITFADYGTGAKPKLWGSVILANSEFQPAGKGLYTYSITTPVLAALVDHQFLYYKAPHNAPPEPLFWSFSGSTLTINSPRSDPRIDGKLYTAVVRQDIIYSNYKNHLTFYNLAADESAAPDGGYAFRIMGSEDVRMDHCEAYRAGKHHFGVINSTRVIGTNLYAAWAMPGLGHGGGIAYVSYGDATSPLPEQTSEWHNCVWDHPDDPQDKDSYFSFYCHGAKLTSVLVDKMISLGGNFSVATEENSGTKVLVHGGLVQNARVEVYGRNSVFEGMRITGPLATLDMIGSDLTFQNMIIDGTNLGNSWYQSAIVSRGTGNTLRFSTVAVDPHASPITTCIAVDSKGTPGAKFSYYGNILLAPGRVVKQWSDHPLGAEFSEVRYNFYSPRARFNDRDINLTQWQAAGFDGGSLQGDPMFQDRTHGDYRLRKGSPAIDAVPPISTFEPRCPISEDFSGGARQEGAAPDMGALEYRNQGDTPPAADARVFGAVIFGLTGALVALLRRRKPVSTGSR